MQRIISILFILFCPCCQKLFFIAFLLLSTCVLIQAQSIHSYNSGMNCHDVWKLPDTGQTLCYDTSYSGSVIPCPDPNEELAQDGTYTPVATQINYTSDLSVTVSTDNVTGLVWMANPAGGAGFTEPVTWEVAISTCEDLHYAGYEDWRLPNARELMSIINFGMTPSPFITTAYFPDTFPDVYWTSTTYVKNQIQMKIDEEIVYLSVPTAWGVNFNDGTVSFYDKGSNHYVRCVRGGS